MTFSTKHQNLLEQNCLCLPEWLLVQILTFHFRLYVSDRATSGSTALRLNTAMISSCSEQRWQIAWAEPLHLWNILSNFKAFISLTGPNRFRQWCLYIWKNHSSYPISGLFTLHDSLTWGAQTASEAQPRRKPVYTLFSKSLSSG